MLLEHGVIRGHVRRAPWAASNHCAVEGFERPLGSSCHNEGQDQREECNNLLRQVGAAQEMDDDLVNEVDIERH